MKRFILPVMLMLGAAAPAFAQSGNNNAQLDPDVRAKVMAVGAKYRDQAKPIWQDARATRQSLQAELGKAQPDDATLTQLEDRLASDRQQMMAIHQQKTAELKKELTPKQYAELMLRRPRFGRHMHGHFRDGSGGQGGGVQQ